MLNLTGRPTTLAQRSFGVVGPENPEQVEELLTRAGKTDAELQRRAETLADFAAAANADAALIRGTKGSPEFELLALALSGRGIRALDTQSKVFGLSPLDEHSACR